MCGIAGFVSHHQSPRYANKDAIIAKMLNKIRHRGPDGMHSINSNFESWSATLGHTRLAIIDLNTGKQPMSNEDQTVWIAFNGEIYNFRELRKTLIDHGHQFSTQSDTEVIIHHFEQKREKSLTDLNGMFAFAIWDEKTGELILARDRSGIKPLYYAINARGEIAFASELTSLCQFPEISHQISDSALATYFFNDYVSPPQTMLSSVNKLEPGTYLRWKNGTIIERSNFWQLNLIDSPLNLENRSEDQLISDLTEKLNQAVTRQLVADVPLGIFLSGGIDSSVVAAIAQKNLRDPILTFSIGFENKDFDESQYAREVSKHIGSRHVEEVLNETKMLDTIEKALLCLDEPMADPSILPTYFLSQLAAKHVKVALGGDGGDELWAGYPTYRAHAFSKLGFGIPSFLLRHGIGFIFDLMPTSEKYQSLEWQVKRFCQRWDSNFQLRHLRWMSNTDIPDLKHIFKPEAIFDPTHFPILKKIEGQIPADEINALIKLDFQTYMSGSVLTKVDRAAMAHGLEVRPPFLDNELIDWAYSLNSHFKLRGMEGKYLLKKAAQSLIPSHIIYRRKKGFAIPLNQWIRGPLNESIRSIIKDSPVWDRTPLNRDTFENWRKEHSRREFDRSKPLWALMSIHYWLKRLE